MSKRIVVEIDCGEVVDVPYLNDLKILDIFICNKLRDAGIPVIGGPLWPKVDFSKGILTQWYVYEDNRWVYVWKEKSNDGEK